MGRMCGVVVDERWEGCEEWLCKIVGMDVKVRVKEVIMEFCN